MVKWEGQDIGCEFFLVLYEYRNKQYFVLDNHCADLISNPVDCNGNKICNDIQDFDCRNYYKESKRIGIVGIGD